MIRADTTRRRFLGGAATAALGAFALPAGAADPKKDDPIGGIGGTGIVGTLTDFGSLMVNGRRILLTPETDISGPLGPVAEADLAIGQALTIEAAGDTAARVFVADPVIGRVKAVDAAARAFWVDGVQVSMAGASGALPQSGQRIAVSGLWRGDGVVATRFAPTDAQTSALAGVFRTEQSKLPRIGSERLLLPSGMAEPADGTFVVVRGRHQAGAFFVDEMDAGRFTGAAGPLIDLSVEGYLDPAPQAPFFELAGLGHSFDPGARLDDFRDDRAIFEGPYTGLFAVAGAKVMPAMFDEQRAVLRRGGVEARSTR